MEDAINGAVDAAVDEYWDKLDHVVECMLMQAERSLAAIIDQEDLPDVYDKIVAKIVRQL